MLEIDSKYCHIVGAKLNGKIVSFIIFNYVMDNVKKESWCVIRYYKSTGENMIDEYVLNRLLIKIKSHSYNKKIYSIGIPSYIVNKNQIFTDVFKNKIIDNGFTEFKEKRLICKEKIAFFKSKNK